MASEVMTSHVEALRVEVRHPEAAWRSEAIDHPKHGIWLGGGAEVGLLVVRVAGDPVLIVTLCPREGWIIASRSEARPVLSRLQCRHL